MEGVVHGMLEPTDVGHDTQGFSDIGVLLCRAVPVAQMGIKNDRYNEIGK